MFPSILVDLERSLFLFLWWREKTRRTPTSFNPGCCLLRGFPEGTCMRSFWFFYLFPEVAHYYPLSLDRAHRLLCRARIHGGAVCAAKTHGVCPLAIVPRPSMFFFLWKNTKKTIHGKSAGRVCCSCCYCCIGVVPRASIFSSLWRNNTRRKKKLKAIRGSGVF